MTDVNNYDKFAKDRQKDILSGAMKSHSMVEKPAMESILPNLKDKKVLMLGCGTGDETLLLSKRGATKLIGIDISSKSIEIAKKTYPNYSFQIGDIDNLEFSGSSFDFVYSSLALDYTNNPLRVYKEVYRVLKTGGGFLFSVPHPIRWSSVDANVKGHEMRVLGFAKYDDDDFSLGNYFSYEKHIYTFNDRGEEKLSFWSGPPSMHFNLLRKAGFRVDNFIETKAIEKAREVDEIYYNKFSKLPQFSIFLATKE